jgi:exopolysaccharide biosynthesis polyprenyl glycosylphosphotransferase
MDLLNPNAASGVDPALAAPLSPASIDSGHRLGRRGWLMRRMLVLADAFGMVAALALTELIVRDKGGISPIAEVAVVVGAFPLWVVAARLSGLYNSDEERADHSTVDEIVKVFNLVTFGVWVIFYGTVWITGVSHTNEQKLATFWLLAIVLVTTSRATARTATRRLAGYVQRTIIVGAGNVGQLIGRKMLQHPEYGMQLIGFVDASPRERRGDLSALTVLGAPHDLPALVVEHDVDRVIFAFTSDAHEWVLELARELAKLKVQVDIVPRLFEIVSPSMTIHSIEGLPLISVPPVYLSRSSRILKRATDVSLSLAALLAITPSLVLIALAIKLDSRGPVFFRQPRMGRGDRPFRIFKFRTMTMDADERKESLAALNKHHASGDTRMFKIPDDPRVTRIGKLLRRWSLDELPQLLNVLGGDMSLVGPRPLVLDEDNHVVDWGRRRLDLKPGITGLWQVLGRDDIPFEEMVKLDYLYVSTWSLGQDIKLLAKTVPSVFRRPSLG